MPWLPMPAEWERSSVAAQEAEPESMLALYRAALHRRHELAALTSGGFAWRVGPPGSLVFERSTTSGTVVCAVNVDASSLPLPDGELVLASEALAGPTLPPGAAAWLRK
jgi:alpha-glucosidase